MPFIFMFSFLTSPRGFLTLLTVSTSLPFSCFYRLFGFPGPQYPFFLRVSDIFPVIGPNPHLVSSSLFPSLRPFLFSHHFRFLIIYFPPFFSPFNALPFPSFPLLLLVLTLISSHITLSSLFKTFLSFIMLFYLSFGGLSETCQVTFFSS